jgi:hypothetical protein
MMKGELYWGLRVKVTAMIRDYDAGSTGERAIALGDDGGAIV